MGFHERFFKESVRLFFPIVETFLVEIAFEAAIPETGIPIIPPRLAEINGPFDDMLSNNAVMENEADEVFGICCLNSRSLP